MAFGEDGIEIILKFKLRTYYISRNGILSGGSHRCAHRNLSRSQCVYVSVDIMRFIPSDAFHLYITQLGSDQLVITNFPGLDWL